MSSCAESCRATTGDIEASTRFASRLLTACSSLYRAPAIYPDFKKRRNWIGVSGGARTHGRLIHSQELYRLSYTHHT